MHPSAEPLVGSGMAPVPQHSPPGQPALQEELQEHRFQLFPYTGTPHFITANFCHRAGALREDRLRGASVPLPVGAGCVPPSCSCYPWILCWGD